jgi:hypothetical protein
MKLLKEQRTNPTPVDIPDARNKGWKPNKSDAASSGGCAEADVESVTFGSIEFYKCPVTPTPTPPPTSTPVTPPTPPTTPRNAKIPDLLKNVTARPDKVSTIDPQVVDDFEYLRHDADSPAKRAGVEHLLKVKYDLDGSGKDMIVIALNVSIQDAAAAGGTSSASRAFLHPVFKNNSGEWGWANVIEYSPDDLKNALENFDPVATTRHWLSFDSIFRHNENYNRGLKNIIMEEENNSLSEMIDDKLREFNFYSANDKGKQKVVFTDEDREEISKEFDDLIKKYPEDIAFIRAVVIAKGEDKKSGEPIVRLGSYYNNSNIELPFNSQMNGLGKLLDGGIIYFTVINNEGPDYRDFKIVGGDKIPEVEFNDKDKEEIALDNYTHSHDQEMAEMDEPFEEVMKKKEQKGLASLLDGDLTNDLTKRQKEVLENLKKKGFKFEKPENADIYERVRVSSKEVNESIKAWKPKK